MDMAVASIAAQPSSENCKICRRPAPRGAKLCAQCQAAVRRARQVPSVVSELLPVTTRTASPVQDKLHPRSTTNSARRVVLPPFSNGWGTYFAFVAFGVAVSVTGYLAIDEIDSTSGGEPISSGAPAALGEGAVSGGAPAALALDPDTPTPVEPAAPQTLSALQEDDDSPQIATGRTAPLASRAAPARPPGRLSSRHPATIPVTVTERLPASASVSRIASGGPDSAPAPADKPARPSQATRSADPPESAVPDRWQVLRAAVARCAKENFLAGFVCDQRARLQYCDGHWGEVPECPGGNRADSGR